MFEFPSIEQGNNNDSRAIVPSYQLSILSPSYLFKLWRVWCFPDWINSLRSCFFPILLSSMCKPCIARSGNPGVFFMDCFSRVTVESAEESDKLKQSFKEEKQTRKRLESKVEHIEEELNDLKHEKESLEKVGTVNCVWYETWHQIDTYWCDLASLQLFAQWMNLYFCLSFQGLTDRKKKHAADKKKFEEELEDLRSQQEVTEKVFRLQLRITSTSECY